MAEKIVTAFRSVDSVQLTFVRGQVSNFGSV
jgi:hypothetical protein